MITMVLCFRGDNEEPKIGKLVLQRSGRQEDIRKILILKTI